MSEGVLADIAWDLVAVLRRDVRTDWTVRDVTTGVRQVILSECGSAVRRVSTACPMRTSRTRSGRRCVRY